MIRSIFLITEYGGENDNPWQRTREFGFLTYEEAENKLLKNGWTKCVTWNGTSVSCDNPNYDGSYLSPYFARINEHKFYDKNFEKENL